MTLVIVDKSLVESSFRAVRYATQPEKIPNEAALLKLEPIDNFSNKAEFTEMRMAKSQDSPLTLVITGIGRCTSSIQQS